MSGRDLELAKKFYRGLGAADPSVLLDVLHPGFRAKVTAGLPHGWGGTYESAREMLERCWARVFASLDIRPIPEEYLPSGPERLVVLGRYVGAGRSTDRKLDAAFAHVLRFRDGRITELIQITDSARWHEALRPSG